MDFQGIPKTARLRHVRKLALLGRTKHAYTLCFVEIDRWFSRSYAGFVELHFTKTWYLSCFIEADIVDLRVVGRSAELLCFTVVCLLGCFFYCVLQWFSLVGWLEKGVFGLPEALKEYRKGF